MADEMFANPMTNAGGIIGDEFELPGLMRYRATIIWDGYIYHREKAGLDRSWWKCRLNRPRLQGEKLCMGRAVYANQHLVITIDHSHGPETSSQNYIPSECRTPEMLLGRANENSEELAAVQGFVWAADQQLLQFGGAGTTEKRHRCELCGLKFAIARVLEAHMMLEHQVQAQCTCSLCGMQFLQPDSHDTHLRICHSRSASRLDTTKCPPSTTNVDKGQTQSVFPEPQIVVPDEHIRSAEVKSTSQTNKSRPVTRKSAITPKSQPEKETSVGSSEDMEAVDSSSGNTEPKRRGGKKKSGMVYECEYCSQRFPHPCKLKVHRRKHTGERPYKCSMCPQAFLSSSRRGAHFKNAHLKVRKHLCTLCGKGFTMTKTLNEHMRTHTGEKPHTCPFCARAFSKKSAMTVHLRQHTGEKPYVCDQCGESFTVNVSLRSHLRSKHGIIVDTGFSREVAPGDSSVPAIGRPKREDAQRQLLLAQHNGVTGQAPTPVAMKNEYWSPY